MTEPSILYIKVKIFSKLFKYYIIIWRVIEDEVSEGRRRDIEALENR